MRYALAGLNVRSDFPLPGLVERNHDTESEAARSIVIRRARVSDSLPGATSVFSDGEWDGNQLLLRIHGAARYLITSQCIDVDPVEAADLGDVRAYLLGTVFGALCHLRGIFPLHASAIELSGQYVAFAGDSGAGKSTMAAALASRGLQVLTDDVAYVRVGAGEPIMAWPGISRLRLWESAMAGLHISQADAEREFRGYNKYLLPAASPRNPEEPRALGALYQLAESPELTKPNIEPLRGAEAFEVVLRNVYRRHLAEKIGKKTDVFASAAAVARQVPIFRLSRPLDFRSLETVLDSLLDHVQSNVHHPVPVGA